VVIVITEGGLTNSVIGTIKAARKLYSAAEDAARHLYYVYNNPDEVLREFERILPVFDDEGITKISLHTGPMALGGSTRMQASTIQQYVLSTLLEDAYF
jgi:N-acetylmuramic acid 6-phosphate (MurNAc-6-P) etherase